MKVEPPPCRPESPDLDSILVEGVAEPGLPPAQYVALPVGTNGEFLSEQSEPPRSLKVSVPRRRADEGTPPALSLEFDLVSIDASRRIAAQFPGERDLTNCLISRKYLAGRQARVVVPCSDFDHADSLGQQCRTNGRPVSNGHSLRAIAGQLECGVATVHRALSTSGVN